MNQEKRSLRDVTKIGLFSGLHYGNPGYREGLWHLAAEKFKQEQVDFIVLVGGLVDGKSLYLRLKEIHQQISCDHRRGEKSTIGEKKVEATIKFLEKTSQELAAKIPRIDNVKIYLITAPAYDKDIGQTIAERLAELRDDIWLYGQGDDRLQLKKINKILGVYAGKKAIWMRGDYYDTPILRVLKDEKKRGTEGLGDINVVGCLASAVHNPGDSTDIQKPYLSLPVLYKIDETRIAENQIGICILTFRSDVTDLAKEATVTTYSFKDLIANEWNLVKAPSGSTKIHRSVIRALKKRGALTIGQLEDETGYSRDGLEKAINELQEKRRSKFWPGIYMPKGSNRYFFGLEWFQSKFRYKFTNSINGVDKTLAFCCLHAGCKHTDMKFFRDEVPKLILNNDIERLIGCGDFIEGLYHDLWLRGEMLTSRDRPATYDWQENLAAYLVGSVIAQVFDVRINDFLQKVRKYKNKNRFSQEEIISAVNQALIEFIRIKGNHCRWTERSGFNALSSFDKTLKDFIIKHLNQVLFQAGLNIPNLFDLVREKLIKLEPGQKYRFPSGLIAQLYHPEMARTKTTSIRLQSVLAMATDSQVVFEGNFHTAEALEEWSPELGQRVCVQLGTIKRDSGFERGKLKIVDFGVAVLNVTSIKQRIIKTETAFYGVKADPIKMEKTNLKVLIDFERWLNANE